MSLITMLSGSENRVSILAVVINDAKTLADIVHEVDAPRSTTRYNLTKLVNEGLVNERLDHTYHATTTGVLTYRAFRRCRDEVQAAGELSPFLDHVDLDIFPDSLEDFRDATLIVPSDADPYRPMSAFADLLRDADRVRVYLPTVTSLVQSALFEAAGDASQRMKILVDESTFREFGQEFPQMASVRTVADPIGFGVAITGESVALCCFDDEMIVRGLVRTDNPAVRQWAIELFHHHWVGIDAHPIYTDRMSWLSMPETH